MGGKLTQAPATPELVERLRDERHVMQGDGLAALLATTSEAAAALEAQQARIAELEVENEQLRLAVCGGEDAPGYASSLPLETILKVCADNHATARRDGQMAWNGDTATSWRSCAEKAQALADRYEKTLDLALDVAIGQERRLIKYGKPANELAWLIEQIRQAFSSQGRHEGGKDGLPELPGVNAVPLPASPDGPLSDGWLDISTAPKDGTAIQARIPGHGEDNVIEWISDALDDGQGSCGAWTFSHEDQEPPPCWSDGWCWAVNEDGLRSAWPTAWKPLPSPNPTNPEVEHG